MTSHRNEVYSCLIDQAGVQAAEALRPNVILCDIGMSEMDGYQTARQIREQPWGGVIPLIAVSGYGQMEDQERARDAGFEAHLLKPIELDVLMHMLAGRQDE